MEWEFFSELCILIVVIGLIFDNSSAHSSFVIPLILEFPYAYFSKILKSLVYFKIDGNQSKL
jgi:hypothetical protein